MVKRWEIGTVDEYKDVWIRIYKIHGIAWHSNFFIALAEVWGMFICLDEKTANGKVFDVARMLPKVLLFLCVSDSICVCIDGVSLQLLLREDALG